MQSAALVLQDCSFTGNKGAGLDASGSSAVTVSGDELCTITPAIHEQHALPCHDERSGGLSLLTLVM
jgi:hypothetical protein